jgi:hypothetical protein
MSQYDAAAEPMWRCFADTANPAGFDFIPAQIDMFEVNTAYNEWQRKSETFDFSKEDLVADIDFNAVLWYAIKGDKSPCPAPIRSAFLNIIKEDD